MTHDELRDRIDDFDCAGMVTEPAVAALRAVVELHKPEEFDGRLGKRLGCTYCIDELSGRQELYPCSTIQVIEKELQ